MEYLVVHFPRSRRVLIDDEFNGKTEEVLEIEAGRHIVSLGPPYDNYTPDLYMIILKNTSELEPREVSFELKSS